MVVAERQTSGRGRQGRSWFSPAGGLYLTCLLRPMAARPLTSLATGIAVAEALQGEGARLKWPNDVLIQGKKVAGVLVEGRWGNDRPEWVALGIGVNTERIVVPADIPGTSVARGREDLLACLLPKLAHWLAASDSDVLAAWRALNVTLGQQVTVRRADQILHGLAQDIDLAGHLLLETAEGPVTIGSGWLI